MFHEVTCFEHIVQQIALERIRFEREAGHTGNELNADDFYWSGLEMMRNLADEETYLDHTDSTLFKFHFSELEAFYTLCREHSRKNRINFKKNPYVKGASAFVDNAFRSSGAWNFAWNLWVPRRLVHKKAYTVLVELGCEFMEWPEMIQTIYEIKDYYTEQTAQFREELYGKPHILNFPTAPATTKEERKAA